MKKTMELMEGCMVRSGGDEYMWGKVPYVPSLCSLIIFLTYLQITIMFFFLFFFPFFLFWKTPRLPKRGFHARCFRWVPQGRFSPRDLLIIFSFLFFFIIGLPHEVFNPNMGLRHLMDIFTWIVIPFSFFIDLMRKELELASSSSLSY